MSPTSLVTQHQKFYYQLSSLTFSYLLLLIGYISDKIKSGPANPLALAASAPFTTYRETRSPNRCCPYYANKRWFCSYKGADPNGDLILYKSTQCDTVQTAIEVTSVDFYTIR